MNVLSIEAWRTHEGGWTWNSWHKVGEVESVPDTNRGVIKLLRDEGYLSEKSKGRVTVEDDGYNKVVVDRNTREPLFAIEYGPDC
jgi:hypothetical protein